MLTLFFFMPIYDELPFAKKILKIVIVGSQKFQQVFDMER